MYVPRLHQFICVHMQNIYGRQKILISILRVETGKGNLSSKLNFRVI